MRRRRRLCTAVVVRRNDQARLTAATINIPPALVLLLFRARSACCPAATAAAIYQTVSPFRLLLWTTTTTTTVGTTNGCVERRPIFLPCPAAGCVLFSLTSKGLSVLLRLLAPAQPCCHPIDSFSIPLYRRPPDDDCRGLSHDTTIIISESPGRRCSLTRDRKKKQDHRGSSVPRKKVFCRRYGTRRHDEQQHRRVNVSIESRHTFA
jgi:hypothetical protein